jgi:uridine kinase
VLEQIRARLAAVDGADLVLVAVDGPGRLGAELARALEPDAVVRMEDFPRDGHRDHLDAQEAYELCFDWGRLVEEVLDPIAVGQAGRYARDGGVVVEVPARGLVVVDGPFSTRPQLRGYYDLMVWVDGPTPTGRAAEDWFAANVGPPADALVLSADR